MDTQNYIYLERQVKNALTSNWFISVEKFNTVNVIYEHQLTVGFENFLNNSKIG